jgi:hypothetical protein
MLNEKIIEAIQSDGDFNKRQQQIILDNYDQATQQEKERIDNIFIALTGWSLESLIEGV